MNPSFDTLMSVLNSIITTLNDSGFNIYDAENEDYYITRISYDPDTDKLLCEYAAESGE